jgi:hypothetical protein
MLPVMLDDPRDKFQQHICISNINLTNFSKRVERLKIGSISSDITGYKHNITGKEAKRVTLFHMNCCSVYRQRLLTNAQNGITKIKLT